MSESNETRFFTIFDDHETVELAWSTRPGKFLERSLIAFCEFKNASQLVGLETLLECKIQPLIENWIYNQTPVGVRDEKVDLSENGSTDSYQSTTTAIRKSDWRHEIWISGSHSLILILKFTDSERSNTRSLDHIRAIESKLSDSGILPIEPAESFQIGGSGSKGIDHGIYGKGGLGMVPLYGHTYLKTSVPTFRFFEQS